MRLRNFCIGAALLLLSITLLAQQVTSHAPGAAVRADGTHADTEGHTSRKVAQNPGVPWPATDALGRSLPTSQQVGPSKPDHFVGIFYFLTHTEGPRNGVAAEPLNLDKILKQDPDALKKPDSPLWGKTAQSHYWGEPLYGYYHSADPWVLRHHAQLLADAGVDVLIFDTTNAVSYPQVYFEILKSFEDLRRQGGHTPQVAFMVNTQAGKTAQEIYRALYKPGLYRDLWFTWQGKPLMICDPGEANGELKSFFTLRAAHWPFTLVNTKDAWHWETTYPQNYGYTDDPNRPEEINVSVAQNLRADDGKVTNMSEGFARGRSFHDGEQHIAPGSVNQGYNFQEQWKRVFALDPPFVMITGWNEWTAGRFSAPGKPVVFVDQFDEEFSRGIDPQKGGHSDDYYYQMVANPALTVNVDGGFDQWKTVGPEFHAEEGRAVDRDFSGVNGLHYTNKTVRNDFVASKIARDDKYVYFYVRTRSAITSPNDPNWMWLLIDSDQNAKTGWAGYDFILNRTVDANGQTWLEKNTGDWNWKKVARVTVHIKGDEMQLAIPRAALGMSSGAQATRFDFKWADNLEHPGDVMDFYLDGDIAPLGRFNYRYAVH